MDARSPHDIAAVIIKEQQVDRDAERGEQAGGNEQALGAAQPVCGWQLRGQKRLWAIRHGMMAP